MEVRPDGFLHHYDSGSWHSCGWVFRSWGEEEAPFAPTTEEVIDRLSIDPPWGPGIYAVPKNRVQKYYRVEREEEFKISKDPQDFLG